MSRESLNRLVILMVCVFVLLAVNLFITTKLFLNAKKSPLILRAREPLPCRVVPTRFVMEDPECANKLLRSMNITNVRILPAATSNTISLKRISDSKALSLVRRFPACDHVLLGMGSYC